MFTVPRGFLFHLSRFSVQKKVAKIVHCGAITVTRYTRRRLRAYACDSE